MIKKLVLFSALCFSANSFSQWFFDKTGGAFDDKPTYVALVSANNYIFGFRCKDKDKIEAIYITTEKAKTKTLDTINLTKPNLMIRIDKNEIKLFLTALTSNSGADNKTTAVSTVDANIIKQLIASKKSISVALKMITEIFHENTFNVTGSTKIGNKLIKACNIDVKE